MDNCFTLLKSLPGRLYNIGNCCNMQGSEFWHFCGTSIVLLRQPKWVKITHHFLQCSQSGMRVGWETLMQICSGLSSPMTNYKLGWSCMFYRTSITLPFLLLSIPVAVHSCNCHGTSTTTVKIHSPAYYSNYLYYTYIPCTEWSFGFARSFLVAIWTAEWSM